MTQPFVKKVSSISKVEGLLNRVRGLEYDNAELVKFNEELENELRNLLRNVISR